MLAKNIKYIGHIEWCERQISTRILIKLLDILQVQPSEFYKFDTCRNSNCLNFLSWHN